MDEQQPQAQVQGSIIGDHAKQWNDFSKHFYFLAKPFVTSPQENSNRQKMIARVGAFWIDGVLKQSLHNEVRLRLELHEMPDAVANPWRLILQEGRKQTRSFPSNTPIIEIYDQADNGLLILGEAGAGKTTLLLELTHELLSRANQSDTHPIPIVFNLSSWSAKRQPLEAWLVEELNFRYQVPKNLSLQWIKDEQLILLLDGLDEVASEYRAECIQIISDYRKVHGLVPIVVCSRIKEYMIQKKRALLGNAVVIQPLTLPQVDHYLSVIGDKVASLRAALSKDSVLQELATTPLMLSILVLSYQGTSTTEISTSASLSIGRRQVFEAYVERMLERRGVQKYTSQQTKHWLMYLAQQMAEQDQTIFYIEYMQPMWLSGKYVLFLYRIINKVLVGMFFICQVRLSQILLLLALPEIFSGPNKVDSIISNSFTPNGFGSLLLIYVLATSPFNVGWIKQIKPVETLIRSQGWVNFLHRFITRLTFIYFMGLFALFFIGLLSKSVWGNDLAAISGLFFPELLAIALVDGMSTYQLDKNNLVEPNQGIRNSARNSLIAGAVVGLIFGLIGFLIAGPKGLILGLVGLIMAGLRGGGLAWIQHSVLRVFLKCSKNAPLNYPRFLNYATEHILLHKVGGGYIFVHRYLQQYFATLGDPLPPDNVTENTQVIATFPPRNVSEKPKKMQSEPYRNSKKLQKTSTQVKFPSRRGKSRRS